MLDQVVVVAARRTPIGNFGGALKDMSPVDLGVKVVQAVVEDAGIQAQDVDEVIFGNVLGAGLGQNITRQIAIKAGLPESSTALTINMVCGSGLETVALAAMKLAIGDAKVIIAGGTESMSQAPYVLQNQRWGARMGDVKAVDTMLRDGLTDAFEGYHMGITAENIAEKFDITREDQDAFAAVSQEKAIQAIESGRFKEEIVPIEIPQRKGDPILFDTDEGPRKGVTKDSLAKLRPAFKKDGGTVSAGNASSINDGAAAVVMTTRAFAEEHGLEILATIKSYANGGVDPAIMGTGPIPATRKALDRAGLSIEDIDLIEANEAFAVQALSVSHELNFDPEKTNVNGGAIALGHPIGASGTRIFVTLLHEMQKRHSHYGLATLCIGGGQGVTVIVERDQA